MPRYLKNCLKRHSDADTCLVTGEVAFKALGVAMAASFDYTAGLERWVVALESRLHESDELLEGLCRSLSYLSGQ